LGKDGWRNLTIARLRFIFGIPHTIYHIPES
jgi:hypothetical protein